MNPFFVLSQMATAVTTSTKLWIVIAVVATGTAIHLPRLSAQTDATARKAKVQAITETEARALADSLEAAALEGNVKAFSNLIDWKAIIDRATALPESQAIDKSRSEFRKSALDRATRSGLAASISTAIRQGGTYKCVRINVTDKTPYVMFRLALGKQAGLNYHKLLLARNTEGHVVVDDLYVFISAELMSGTLQRAWRTVANQMLKTNAEKAALGPDPFLANSENIQKVTGLVRLERFPEALKAYNELPAVVRQDKSLLIIRLRAAQAISEEEYAKGIADFRKFHPNDVALDFILIDGYVMLKQYDLALKCVDSVDKSVGGDAAMLVKRAAVLLLLKRVPEARQAVEDAIAAEPDYYDAYTTGADVSLAEKNFDETVKYLTILETKFEVVWPDLRNVPVFAEFVKSDQYRKWAATRTNQSKE